MAQTHCKTSLLWCMPNNPHLSNLIACTWKEDKEGTQISPDMEGGMISNLIQHEISTRMRYGTHKFPDMGRWYDVKSNSAWN